MNLKHIIYLVEVDKTKSLSKAAQNLLISQPSISKAISSLEAEFNITILKKHNRGVEFTYEGKEFLENVKYIVRQVENLERIYTSKSRDESFNLKVSSDIIFTLGGIISKVYNSIEEDHINFSVKECFKEQVIIDVAEMKADIGLFTLNSIEEKIWRSYIEINNIDFHEIRKEGLYVYVGKKSKLYDKKEIEFIDLVGLTRIHLIGKTTIESAHNITPEFKKILREEKILCLNDKETISKVLEETDTYTFAAGCKNNEYRDNIRAIPLVDKSFYTILGWIKRSDYVVGREAKIFLEVFLESLE